MELLIILTGGWIIALVCIGVSVLLLIQMLSIIVGGTTSKGKE